MAGKTATPEVAGATAEADTTPKTAGAAKAVAAAAAGGRMACARMTATTTVTPGPEGARGGQCAEQR